MIGVPPEAGELWPVLRVAFVATVCVSAFYGFIGVWAVTRLHATPGQVGTMLSTNAVLVIGAGYLGGRISDSLGRKPVLVSCLAVQAVLIIGCSLVGERLGWGFALVIIASTVGTPAIAARNVLVADLAPPSQRSLAFSSLRVVNNLASVLGPALVGLLLLSDAWSINFLVLGMIGLASAVMASRLPNQGRPPPVTSEAVARASRGGLLRDRPYLMILLSTLLGSMVYVAFASVLPVVVVDGYGYAPSTWALLAAINPILVVLGQASLTRRTESVSYGRRIAVGCVLMGAPWLLLLLNHGLVLIVIASVAFVVGEMLWSPSSQAAATELAPEEHRGAYLGAFSSTMSVAWAIGPLVGLQLFQHAGDQTLWAYFAVVALGAAITGLVAGSRLTQNTPA